jgi:hypothetical protein
VTRRIPAAAAALGVTGALIGVGAAGVGAHTTNAGKRDNGTAYISINRTGGGHEYASGTNTDKVLGKGAITYVLKLASSTGEVKLTSKHVVLYTPTGSLTGTGSADVTFAGNAETIKNGKLDLTTGRGSQKGHTLKATFSGTGSTTSNVYVFHYKGTYK